MDIYRILVACDLWLKPEPRDIPFSQRAHPIPTLFRTAAGGITEQGVLHLPGSAHDRITDLRRHWPHRPQRIVLLFDSFDRSFRNLESKSSQWGYTDAANTYGLMWSEHPEATFQFDRLQLRWSPKGLTLFWKDPLGNVASPLLDTGVEGWATLLYNEEAVFGQTHYSETQVAIRYEGKASRHEFVPPSQLQQIPYHAQHIVDVRQLVF